MDIRIFVTEKTFKAFCQEEDKTIKRFDVNNALEVTKPELWNHLLMENMILIDDDDCDFDDCVFKNPLVYKILIILNELALCGGENDSCTLIKWEQPK